MRGRSSRRPVIWTLAELSAAAGLSPYRTEKLLRGNNVKIHRTGTAPKSRKVIFISSLDVGLSDFLDSLRYRHEED